MEMTRFNNRNGFPAVMWSFNDSVDRFEAGENQMRPWTPAVDILEMDNELIFRVDAPDVDLAHTEVQLENGTLTLKGERRIEKDVSVKGYHRMERRYGAFARSFTLPEAVDAEDVRSGPLGELHGEFGFAAGGGAEDGEDVWIGCHVGILGKRVIRGGCQSCSRVRDVGRETGRS